MDSNRYRFVWTWPDGRTTRSQLSGWITDKPGPSSVQVRLDVYEEKTRIGSAAASFIINAPERIKVNLTPGVKLPVDLGSNKEYDGNGGTYEIDPVKFAEAKGNVMLKNCTLKFTKRGIALNKGEGFLLQDVTLWGSQPEDAKGDKVIGEFFSTIRIKGACYLRVKVRNVDSFIEQNGNTPCHNLMIVDCEQLTPISRTWLYPEGNYIVMYGSKYGPSNTENISRISAPVKYVSWCDNEIQVTGKGAIDMRSPEYIWLEGNRTNGSIRVGSDSKRPIDPAYAVIRDNTSTVGIRIVSGAHYMYIEDNNSLVNISQQDKFDGRPGSDHLYIRSDREVTIYGDFKNKKAFDEIYVTAPSVRQNIVGVGVSDITADVPKVA